MAEKVIEVTIDKDGGVKTDLQGFKGKGCKAIADAFSQALGGKVVNESVKSEYYEGGGGSNVSVGR
jgi:hypothetical protein